MVSPPIHDNALISTLAPTASFTGAGLGSPARFPPSVSLCPYTIGSTLPAQLVTCGPLPRLVCWRDAVAGGETPGSDGSSTLFANSATRTRHSTPPCGTPSCSVSTDPLPHLILPPPILPNRGLSGTDKRSMIPEYLPRVYQSTYK